MASSDWDNSNYNEPEPRHEWNYNGRVDNGDSRGPRRRDFERRGSSTTYAAGNIINIMPGDIGRIIGYGGSNIKYLQTNYRVRISVDKENLNVNVQGGTQADVEAACKQIREQTDHTNRGPYENQRRYAGSSGVGSGFAVGGGVRVDGAIGGGNYRKPRRDVFEEIEKENCDSRSVNYFSNTRRFEEPLIDWVAVNKRSEDARKEKWAQCPPLTKDFYQEKREVANLSPANVARLRIENNDTTVSLVFQEKEGGIKVEIPNPIWKFHQCFENYPDLMAEIKKQGFQKPSPIQAQAWPILLRGHDMIGISQTGSGKTLAFLLPAMIHTELQSVPRNQRGGPNVLVMAPTRELALQIEAEVKKYTFRGMKAVCVYGGGSRSNQIADIKSGVEIIICTPGRLNDLIQANVIDVKSITFLILDEADCMLDMGFEPQIRKVLLDIRPDRQTVMTSATWPEGVRRLAESYMKNPIQVCVGSLDLAATHSVKQYIHFFSDDNDKYASIKHFLDTMQPHDKAIVFCGRKARADDLSSDLTIAGYSTASIHGDRDQHDREQALLDIKSGMVKILIATDIASRGIDIEDITYVINYDMPRSIQEYVHRVGRTGRAGRTGTSISYLTRENWNIAKELIKILEEAAQDVPDELRDMSQRFAAMKLRRENGGYRRGGFNGRKNY